MRLTPLLVSSLVPLLLATPALAQAGKAAADDDPYRWLEDVTAEKSLDWAKGRNAKSSGELTDEAFRIAEHARLGPLGSSDDMMGPDGYRTSILFQANLPELRNDPRFIRLCARLGLVQFWTARDCWSRSSNPAGRWPRATASGTCS